MQNNFSFSAWCSGNKSTKSIHLRTDHPNSQNIISGNWVEEVKDALLEIGCYSQEPLLIQNPDFDCGVDNKWNLSLYNGAIATYLEASDNVYDLEFTNGKWYLPQNTIPHFTISFYTGTARRIQYTLNNTDAKGNTPTPCFKDWPPGALDGIASFTLDFCTIELVIVKLMI